MKTFILSTVVGVCFFAAAAACPVKRGENLVFIPGYGHLSPDSSQWIIGVQGWVFDPEENSLSRKLMVESFRSVFPKNGMDFESPLLRRRVMPFIVDNKSRRKIKIRSGSEGRESPPTSLDGRVEFEIRLDASRYSPGRVEFQTDACRTNPAKFHGEAFLIPPEGLSVIADIDDTIKDTHVLDKKDMLANTFFREFREVPGMAEVFARWEKEGAAFHYVSASPRQLQGPLEEFLKAKGFPRGLLHLKRVRLRGTSVARLFESPRKYKAPILEKIMGDFPQRKFILVGDSTEEDPEIYAAAARARPEQVRKIVIRDTAGGPSSFRYEAAFRGIPPDRWAVIKDPREIISRE